MSAPTSLRDLRQLRQALNAQQERATAKKKQLQQQREAALAQAERDRQLFRRVIGAVRPLRHANRARLASEPPEPLPLQHWLDEERALQESMSDAFDASTLLDTDDQLSFRRPGIGRDVVHKLRAGHWSIQRQIDLHGLRTDEARDQIGAFIRQAHRHGLRCVRVVHGKGLGSPGKTPVLKSRVHSWLVQKNEVLAFVQARPAEGGAGALVVLLRPALPAGEAARHLAENSDNLTDPPETSTADTRMASRAQALAQHLASARRKPWAAR